MSYFNTIFLLNPNVLSDEMSMKITTCFTTRLLIISSIITENNFRN